MVESVDLGLTSALVLVVCLEFGRRAISERPFQLVAQSTMKMVDAIVKQESDAKSLPSNVSPPRQCPGPVAEHGAG